VTVEQGKPTSERLAEALTNAGAPAEMVAHARDGYYDDYRSPLAMPLIQLVTDALEHGLVGIAEQATNGDFDATIEESDAWAATEEGQASRAWAFSDEGNAILRRFLHPK
jgi:hypothetical protein